ncbi:hypothetical protein EON62_05135, partial [archaeon]
MYGSVRPGTFNVTATVTMSALPTLVPSPGIPTSTPSAAPGMDITATQLAASSSTPLLTVQTPTFYIRFFTLTLPPYASYNVSVDVSLGSGVLLASTSGVPSCATCFIASTPDSPLLSVTQSATWLGLTSTDSASQSVTIRLAGYPDRSTRSAAFVMRVAGTAPTATASSVPSSWMTPIPYGLGLANQYFSAVGTLNYYSVIPANTTSVLQLYQIVGGDPDVMAGFIAPACASCSFSWQYTSSASSTGQENIPIPASASSRTLYIRVNKFSGAPTFTISVGSSASSTSSLPSPSAAPASWLRPFNFGGTLTNQYVTTTVAMNYYTVVPANTPIALRVFQISNGDPDMVAGFTVPSCAGCRYDTPYASDFSGSTEEYIYIAAASYLRVLYFRVYAFTGTPTFSISVSVGNG